MHLETMIIYGYIAFTYYTDHYSGYSYYNAYVCFGNSLSWKEWRLLGCYAVSLL
jgi:hypothetical protein